MKLEVGSLEYLHDKAFGWYQQAESKAEILLGFTGLILSILLAAIISSGADSVFAGLNTSLKVFLLIVLLVYVLAIGFLVYALWSRGVFGEFDKRFVFFGAIADYESANELRRALIAEDSQDEYAKQLIDNLYSLSKNTKKKHQTVNIAAVLMGVALIGTVAFGIITMVSI